MATVKFFKDKEKIEQVYPEIDPDGNYPGVTVGLANNLTSSTGTTITGNPFIYRLTAEGDSTSDGYAELKKLIGTTTSSTIPESLVYNLLTTGVTAITVTKDTFKKQISESGTYNFIYTPTITYTSELVYSLNKTTFANYVKQTTGTYKYTYTAVVSPVDTSSVISKFSQDTFVAKVSETPNTYTFSYDGNNWSLDGTNVTMSEYGITTKGTEESGATVTIYYTSNSWYYDGASISMSSYGITTTGKEAVGDTIEIKYTSNDWMYNSKAVTLSTYGISITSGSAAVDDDIQIVFVAEQVGVVQVANPTALFTTGFNKFNSKGNDILTNYTINTSGNITSSSGYYTIWVKVLGGNTYTVYNADNKAIARAAYSASVPNTSTTGMTVLSVVTTNSSKKTVTNSDYNKHYTPSADGYLVVTSTAIENLCISITWNGYAEGVYESYWDYTLPIKYEDASGNTITDYGMPYLSSTYYDEMNFEDGYYYKRTDRMAYSAANLATVQALGTTYVYDDNYIYYGLPTDKQIRYDLPSNTSMTFQTSDYGTEEFLNTTQPLYATILYQSNLKDKLATEVEVISNKVTSVTSSNTNTEYPSAKAVYNLDNALRHILGLDVDTFSKTSTYAVGDYVVYNGKLWKCTTAVTSAGAWTGTTNWEESYLFKAS